MIYTKTDALKEIFDIELSSVTWPSKKVSKELLLEVICKPTYNLKNDLGICAQSVSVLLKKLWPSKPRSTVRVCSYLLNKYGLKYCSNCTNVHTLDMYHKNKARQDGYTDYCIPCFNDLARDTRKEYEATRRSSKIDRTPAWANLAKIKEIYNNCPKDYHVDHIIPLKGDLVSGLHVESNLQYLTAKENLQKSNKYSPS